MANIKKIFVFLNKPSDKSHKYFTKKMPEYRHVATDFKKSFFTEKLSLECNFFIKHFLYHIDMVSLKLKRKDHELIRCSFFTQPRVYADFKKTEITDNQLLYHHSQI